LLEPIDYNHNESFSNPNFAEGNNVG